MQGKGSQRFDSALLNWAEAQHVLDEPTAPCKTQVRWSPVAAKLVRSDITMKRVIVHANFSVPLEDVCFGAKSVTISLSSSMKRTSSHPVEEFLQAAFGGTPVGRKKTQAAQLELARVMVRHGEAAMFCAKHLPLTDECGRDVCTIIQNLEAFNRMARQLVAHLERIPSNTGQRKTTSKSKSQAARRRSRDDNGFAPRNARPAAGHCARDAPEVGLCMAA
jgi:hypothetical protein